MLETHFDGSDLFPAHAGMNRSELICSAVVFTVPRTRGDEPEALRERDALRICSPHTRG